MKGPRRVPGVAVQKPRRLHSPDYQRADCDLVVNMSNQGKVQQQQEHFDCRNVMPAELIIGTFVNTRNRWPFRFAL